MLAVCLIGTFVLLVPVAFLWNRIMTEILSQECELEDCPKNHPPHVTGQ